ncbi:hypothetical protein GCM10010464_86620 [Pseudonocardia yunnanensis]
MAPDGLIVTFGVRRSGDCVRWTPRCSVRHRFPADDGSQAGGRSARALCKAGRRRDLVEADGMQASTSRRQSSYRRSRVAPGAGPSIVDMTVMKPAATDCASGVPSLGGGIYAERPNFRAILPNRPDGRVCDLHPG